VILLPGLLKVQLSDLFVAQVLDDPPDAFLADIGDGWVIGTLSRFWKLDEDELAVPAVLLVQVENGVSSSAGTSEEVENNVLGRGSGCLR
jgi:hypothetical protein